MTIDVLLFDLGKVVLDWDPRYFYRRFFTDDDAALERFLADAVPAEWILAMDRGEPLTEAIARRQREVPAHARLIGLWREGWPQMLRGELADTVAIVEALERAGYPLYALTNFATETWAIARACCPVLGRFRDIVVSGAIGIVKPEAQIYAHTIERFDLDPARTLFIDDLAINVAAARAAGFEAVQFTDAARLRVDLEFYGVALA
ncbi:MAG: HAD family phosphatase [Proteobacteria bacterium]|nr:HAD family phosphatase [Burkholderiales bacterium]